MQENKLLKQLKILEKEEFKGFYLFIRSAYFNKSKDVIRLLDYLRRYYPTFESPKLNKAIVFKKLFPKQAYSDVKLRNLRTKASKLIEQYLINVTFQQDDFERKKLLTRIYGKRNYYTAFEKNTQQLLETLEQQPYRDASYFYDKYLLQKDYYLHIETAKKEETGAIMQNALSHLTNFFAIERLFLGLDLVNREAIFSEKNHFNPKQNTFKTPSNNFIFQFFQDIINLHTNGTDANFVYLKQLYLDNFQTIRTSYSKEIFLFLINYAIRQLRIKEAVYVPMLFELYELGLKERLFFEKNKINPATFFNIILISSKLKKIEWTNHFIQTYQFQLAEPYSAETRHLAISTLKFNQEKFEEVINLLTPQRFTHLLYELNARTLLLRSYYKLFEHNDTYYPILITQCNSFIKLLQRNQTLQENNKQARLLFAKLLKLITETLYRNDYNEEKKQAFFDMIHQSKGIILKGWLMEILNNLDKNS